MQHWHRFASKRITSWLICANALAMFRPSAPFLVAAWKTSIRRLPRLKDWKSRRETRLKLLRTPSVVSVSLPDNRWMRSALFWDRSQEMWRLLSGREAGSILPEGFHLGSWIFSFDRSFANGLKLKEGSRVTLRRSLHT